MECLGIVPGFSAIGPVLLATKTEKLAAEADDLNAIWCYPLNAVITILAVAAQPLLAVIAMITAPIFKCIACCFTDPDRENGLHKLADSLIDRTAAGFSARFQLLVRIFNPSFELDQNLEVSELQINLANKKNYFLKHRISLLILFPVAPAYTAIQTGKLCQMYAKESRLHALWTYPLNGLVTLLAIAVQPILGVIGLIAAAIFKLIGCCSSRADELATHLFRATVAGFTARAQLVVRIVDPSYYLDKEFHVKNITLDG